MGLRIYNSLTNKIEEFIPNDGKNVNMYVCGMTVYNYIHIGNARPIIFFDMFKRYLTFLGYNVHYASNATDVDDKIIKKALSEGVSEEVISKRYIEALLKDSKRLNSMPVDYFPKATEYIPLMIKFIQELIDAGYAYIIDGDVFFRVSKMENYGLLSNQDVASLEQGARIQVNDKKENPLDFVLWKKTEEGIKWDSPFGSGRPGWHTECVVMINNVFNNTPIDVHGGGMDLKFPHHENEIAQEEAIHSTTLAKYFMHVGRLDMNGEKMSKSLGNVIFVKDYQTHTELMALRMLILFSPYRNIINYTEDLFMQFQKEFVKFMHALKQASLELNRQNIQSDEVKNDVINNFKEYMNDDFNTPNVLTILNNELKNLNTELRSKSFDKLVITFNTMMQIFNCFGIDFKIEDTLSNYQEIYNEWQEARLNKDFEKADICRAKLISGEIL